MGCHFIVYSMRSLRLLKFILFWQAERLQHMFSMVGMDGPLKVNQPKVPLQLNK